MIDKNREAAGFRWDPSWGQGMEVHSKGELQWLSFPLLDQTGITAHGFSTRMGGVSKGIFSSMNLSFTRGDDPHAVAENFRRISSAIGFGPEQIVSSDQTHTTNVRRVGKEHCGSGVIGPRLWKDVDGMVTDQEGVVLATFYADCVPLFFLDPVHRAVGLSHSGWRGTVHRMGQATLACMTREFGTDPDHVIAAIGPSICQSCYEVGPEVIEEFRKSFPEEEQQALYYKKKNGKYQLDLWEANRLILIDAGVPEEQIQVSGLCTCCNPDKLFSHRASCGRRGNLGAFLMLTEEKPS